LKINKISKFLKDFFIFSIAFIIGDNINQYLGLSNNKILSFNFVKSVGVSLTCYIILLLSISAIKYVFNKVKGNRVD
jgi:hypothetical protein